VRAFGASAAAQKNERGKMKRESGVQTVFTGSLHVHTTC
jgi:hypothetical protein